MTVKCHVGVSLPHRVVARKLFIDNYERYQHKVDLLMKLHGEAIYVSLLL